MFNAKSIAITLATLSQERWPLVTLEARKRMPTPVQQSIREAILNAIRDQTPRTRIDPSLQQVSVLKAVAAQVGTGHDEAILTEWGELFRTGILAWGCDLSNPNPPFFHITESGKQALANLSRDPSNPSGYIRHLGSIATVDPVARSYVIESLNCYVAGLFKATAVMVGGAAESLILNLRDLTTARLKVLSKPVPKPLGDWRVKTVSDALQTFFDSHKTQFKSDLREPFEAYWSAFAFQIRTVRNDAGHPTSVDPVTPEAVHASLLIFPELARLANSLAAWVANDFA